MGGTRVRDGCNVGGRGNPSKFMKIPHGFIKVDDGVWGEQIVRMKDGKTLKDCHDEGECPDNCPYCQEEADARESK